MRQGGWAEPAPTARMPPNPAAASSPGSRTRTASPLAAATRAASPASQAGVFRLEGMFARSRASATASAAARAADTAAVDSWSPAESRSRTSLGPPPRSAREASENRYEPSSSPSAKARTDSAGWPRTAAASMPRSGDARRPRAAPALRMSATDSSPNPSSSRRRGLSPARIATGVMSPA